MAVPTSTTDILINIGFQAINIGLFFFVLSKALATPLTAVLLKKVDTEKKLADADRRYKQLLTDGEEQKQILLKQAVTQKDEMIQEAQLLAQKKSDDILAQAQKKADMLQQDALQKAKKIEQDLKDSFVDGVKQTTKLVVNKLLKQEVNLKQTYVDELVQEFVGK